MVVILNLHQSLSKKTKVIIDLGTFGDFRLKFGVYICIDEQFSTVSKFSFSGNDFLKLSTTPHVTLELIKKIDDKSTVSTNLTYAYMIKFKRTLELLLNEMVIHEDLYFIKNNILYINNEASDKIKKIMYSNNMCDKTILIRPNMMMYNDTNIECMSINIDNYDKIGYIGIDDLYALIHRLNNINFDVLVSESLIIYYNNINKEVTPIKPARENIVYADNNEYEHINDKQLSEPIRNFKTLPFLNK